MFFTKVIDISIQKAGSQDNLATQLKLSPAELSKKINGRHGWQAAEVQYLLDYMCTEIVFKREFSEKLSALKKALYIVMEKEG